MSREQELARTLVDAVTHTMGGRGPSSVRLDAPETPSGGVCVFVIPGPVGIIVDDALNRLYEALGWRVAKEGREEAN